MVTWYVHVVAVPAVEIMKKKNHDDILFDIDGLPKGHAVGLLPIVMIAELIVGSKVQNSTTTTCNFFIP